MKGVVTYCLALAYGLVPAGVTAYERSQESVTQRHGNLPALGADGAGYFRDANHGLVDEMLELLSEPPPQPATSRFETFNDSFQPQKPVSLTGESDPMTVGISYRPIPLIGFMAGSTFDFDGVYDSRLGIGLTWDFDLLPSQQLDFVHSADLSPTDRLIDRTFSD